MAAPPSKELNFQITGGPTIKIDSAPIHADSFKTATSLSKIQRILSNDKKSVSSTDAVYKTLKSLMSKDNANRISEMSQNFDFLNATEPFLVSHPAFRIFAALFYNKIQLPVTKKKYSIDASKNLDVDDSLVELTHSTQDFVSSTFSTGTKVTSSKITPLAQITPLDILYHGMSLSERDAEILTTDQFKVEDIAQRLLSNLFVHNDFNHANLAKSLCRKDLNFDKYKQILFAAGTTSAPYVDFRTSWELYKKVIQGKQALLREFEQHKTNVKAGTATDADKEKFDSFVNFMQGGVKLDSKKGVPFMFVKKNSSDTKKIGNFRWGVVTQNSDPGKVDIDTKSFAKRTREKSSLFNSNGESLDEVLKMLWEDVVKKYEHVMTTLLEDTQKFALKNIENKMLIEKEFQFYQSEGVSDPESKAAILVNGYTGVASSDTKPDGSGTFSTDSPIKANKLILTADMIRDYRNPKTSESFTERYKLVKENLDYSPEDIIPHLSKIKPLNDPDLTRLQQQRRYLSLSITPGLFYAFCCYLKFSLQHYKNMFTQVWPQQKCLARKVLRFKAVAGSLAEPDNLRYSIETVLPNILRISSNERLRILRIRFKEIVHEMINKADSLSTFFQMVVKNNKEYLEYQMQQLQMIQQTNPSAAAAAGMDLVSNPDTIQQLMSKHHLFEIEVEIGARDGSNNLSSVEADVSAFLSQLQAKKSTSFDSNAWIYISLPELQEVLAAGTLSVLNTRVAPITATVGGNNTSLSRSAKSRLIRKGKRTSSASSSSLNDEEDAALSVPTETFDYSAQLFRNLLNLNPETVLFTYAGVEQPLYDSNTTDLHQKMCSLNSYRSENWNEAMENETNNFLERMNKMNLMNSQEYAMSMQKTRELRNLYATQNEIQVQIDYLQRVIYQNSGNINVSQQQKLLWFDQMQTLIKRKNDELQKITNLSSALEEKSNIHVATVEDQNRELSDAMKKLNLEEKEKEKQKKLLAERKKLMRSNASLGVRQLPPASASGAPLLANTTMVPFGAKPRVPVSSSVRL